MPAPCDRVAPAEPGVVPDRTAARLHAPHLDRHAIDGSGSAEELVVPPPVLAVEDHEMASLGSAPVHVARGLPRALVDRAFQTPAQYLALNDEALDPGALRPEDEQIRAAPA